MLPLDGIKVLDLTWVLPGHVCTMILGDMGADVIKIEALREGGTPSAPRAGAGVSPIGEAGRRKAAYNPFNRNKRSLPLNLKLKEAQAVFHRLARDADVVIEGFRPGVAGRLKADYATLKEINPRLVYCSMSSYGQDGAYSTLPGHDTTMVAMGGALSLMGRSGEPPLPQSMGVWSDWVGGSLRSALAILLALMARDRTGAGQYIDNAFTDGVVWLMGRHIADYFETGETPRRGELVNTGYFACHSVQPTKDGRHIAIGCSEAHFWADLCRLLGREDYADYQWDTGPKRQEILDYFGEAFKAKDRDEWFELLWERGIPVGKVLSLEELVRDPNLRQRGMLVDVECPGIGKVPQIGVAVHLSETPGRIARPSPLYGEHTDEILREAGYLDTEIQALRDIAATA